MSFWLFGVLFSLFGGCLISFLNYLLSRYILIKKEKFFSAFGIIRQIFNVGYLVILYFIAPKTPWDLFYLLIGGALGITLPMFYFTAKLVKLSEKLKNKPSDTVAQGEEGEKNG